MPKNPLSAILDDPLVSGAGDLASRFGRYVGSGDALRDSAGLAVRVAPDLLRGGPSRVLMKHVAEPMAASLTKDFKANPVRTVAENLPVVGGAMSALEAKDLRQKALEARARGDMEGYRRYSEAAAAAAGMTAVGMIPVPGAAGAKTAAKVGVKAAERDAVRDVSRLAEKYGVEVPSDRMTLWHGSNKEFDAFDRQFLGAGEGRGSTALGNARGSGFYFNDLPPGQGINESRLPKGQTVAEYYADLISRTGGGSPNLYEVSVPKGPLLDYSKPLAQQSPETLAALKSMLGERWVDANPDADVNRVRSAARDHARYSRSLEERMADKDKSPDQIEAETLRRYGIIGTIHQDTPARIMGGSNYAIFDPEDIQIVNRRSLSEKYGLEPK